MAKGNKYLSVIDWQRWQILFPLLKDYWNK
jgi:hypothetical protein